MTHSAHLERITDSSVQPYGSGLEHLAEHLERLHLLIEAYVSRSGIVASMPGGITETASEEQALETRANKLRLLAEAMEERILQRESATDIEIPVRKLVERFGLSGCERDALLFASAGKIDPRFAARWKHARLNFSTPTIELLLQVMPSSLAESKAVRELFVSGGNLLGNSLMLVLNRGGGEGDFLEAEIDVPRRIIGELLGDPTLEEQLVGFSRLVRPTTTMDQVILPQEVKQDVLYHVMHHDRYLDRRKAWGIDSVIPYGKAVTMLFVGEPGTGKTLLAHAVAHTMGKQLFLINTTALQEKTHNTEAALEACFREARLHDAVLFFDECEQLFASRRHGNHAIPALLTGIERFDGIMILATNCEEDLDQALHRRILSAVHFPRPTSQAQLAIWQLHLPSSVPTHGVDLPSLVKRYDLTGGRIKNAVLAAVSSAAHRDDGHLSQADLEHGAMSQLPKAPERLRIRTPRATKENAVLCPGTRSQLLHAVRLFHAHQCRMMRHGEFVSTDSASFAVLCVGPSGSGKGIVAEVLASSLGRSLLTVRIPVLLGLTARHLGEELREAMQAAKEHNAIVVLEDVDSLYESDETVAPLSKILSAMLREEIDSSRDLLLLTAKSDRCIDRSLLAQISCRIDLPALNEEMRAAVWREALRDYGNLSSDIDVNELAQSHPLGYAAVFRSVYLAALEAETDLNADTRITQAMLLRAAAQHATADPSTEMIGFQFRGTAFCSRSFANSRNCAR